MMSETVSSAEAKEQCRFAHFDPATLVDMAYTIHAASDPLLKSGDNAEWRLANAEADAFIKLLIDINTKDGAYLSRVRTVTLSLARSYSRSKGAWLDQCRKATEYHSDSHGKRQKNKKQTLIFKYGARFALASGLSAILVLFMQVMFPYVPEEVAESTGRGWPSLAAAAFVYSMVAYVGFKWDELYRGRTDVARRKWEHHARQDYEEAKLVALEFHWQQLVEAYQRYTGETIREKPAYERVIRSELAAQKELDALIDDQQQNPILFLLWRLLASFNQLRKYRKKETKVLTN